MSRAGVSRAGVSRAGVCRAGVCRARPAVVLLAVALALGGCMAGETASGPAATATAGRPGGSLPAGEVTVFAAASLTDVFETIGSDVERANPGVTVTFGFGGSSSLAQQVVAGAPADVFAAASTATMDTVVAAGDAAADPVVFARNTLQIAVPAGNPGGVTGLADLADPDLTVALCEVEVPCGAAAARVFAAAGVTPAPDTLEQDVRAALAKVQLGEVDAALVYRTDVLAAGESVEGIDVPEAAEAVSDYPVTVLRDAPHREAAEAFVEHLLSAAGQSVLRDAGFQAP